MGRDYLNENDQVTVKVLRMNDRGRYELSVKQCGGNPSPVERAPAAVGVGPPRREARPAFVERPRFERPAPPFEDRLSRFLKDSEERQHDLRRSIESKRGRR